MLVIMKEPHAINAMSTYHLKGGNTKGMINHLKLHDISIQKRNSISTTNASSNDRNSSNDESSSSSKVKKSCIENPIMSKFIKRESREEILAKCAAKDGFSFRAISKSEAIRGYVSSRGYEMPKSESTVKELIMKFVEEKRKELKKTLIDMVKHNLKFSISVDEWMNMNAKRFINITLHNIMRYNLGLTKIDGSCDAEETKRLVSETLINFGFDFKKDIAASTHDAASVMVKYGNEIDAESQLCYNHAIHLAVMNVFYKKSPVSSAHVVSSDDEPDNEIQFQNDDANLNFDFQNTENVMYDIAENFADIIAETRRVCKFFRKSSVRNSILQKHVQSMHGKSLKLVLDCQTRWKSLITTKTREIFQIK